VSQPCGLHHESAVPAAGIDLTRLPLTLQARCGGRSRRDPSRPCGYRFGAWRAAVWECDCGAEVVNAIYAGLERENAAALGKTHEFDRRVRFPFDRQGPVEHVAWKVPVEFPCPECGACPRKSSYTLGRLWLQAAQLGEKAFYVR